MSSDDGRIDSRGGINSRETGLKQLPNPKRHESKSARKREGWRRRRGKKKEKRSKKEEDERKEENQITHDPTPGDPAMSSERDEMA